MRLRKIDKGKEKYARGAKYSRARNRAFYYTFIHLRNAFMEWMVYRLLCVEHFMNSAKSHIAFVSFIRLVINFDILYIDKTASLLQSINILIKLTIICVMPEYIPFMKLPIYLHRANNSEYFSRISLSIINII